MKIKILIFCATALLFSFNVIIMAQPVVTYPNGGEVLNVGSTVTITWTGTVLNTVVGIDYTVDNWINTVWLNTNYQNPSANSYTWVVPNTVGSECQIGIFDLSFSGDVSDNFFTIQTTTDVKEQEFDKNINISPNPASDFILIQLLGDEHFKGRSINCSIRDLSGRCLFQQEISNNNFEIDLSSFNKGLYFVEIHTPEFHVTKKIVVN